MLFVRLSAAAFLGLATCQVGAQPVVPVHLLVESGAYQTVPVSTLLPRRFVVRVVHAQTGAPLPNVLLYFGVNHIGCPFSSIHCLPPADGTYGRFDPDTGPPGAPQAQVLTDADGRAVAPPFTAGAYPFHYELYSVAMGHPSQPGGIYYPGTPPHHNAIFQVTQVSGTPQAAVAVPGLRSSGLLLLAAALWLAAAGARRYLSLRGRT